MFKKLIIMVLSFALILFFGVSNARPIFYGYSNSFEIYLISPSSNAKVISVSKQAYPFVRNKLGESCKIQGEFSITEFLREMKAETIFIEHTEIGTSYYAYSNDIHYKREVCGEVVNLHIFIGENGVTVGSPIIYGSF